jgi:hypothetical protein
MHEPERRVRTILETVRYGPADRRAPRAAAEEGGS